VLGDGVSIDSEGVGDGFEVLNNGFGGVSSGGCTIFSAEGKASIDPVLPLLAVLSMLLLFRRSFLSAAGFSPDND